MKRYQIQLRKKDYLLYQVWNLGSVKAAQIALTKTENADDLTTFCRIPAFFGEGLKNAEACKLHLSCVISYLYGKLNRKMTGLFIEIISPY